MKPYRIPIPWSTDELSSLHIACMIDTTAQRSACILNPVANSNGQHRRHRTPQKDAVMRGRPPLLYVTPRESPVHVGLWNPLILVNGLGSIPQFLIRWNRKRRVWTENSIGIRKWCPCSSGSHSISNGCCQFRTHIGSLSFSLSMQHLVVSI